MNQKLYFFTATILEWKRLLLKDSYKEIIIDSLRFLVNEKRIKIYAFVIMPNHIHLVWGILEQHLRQNVQRDFLKFTAQQFKFELAKENPEFLNEFLVNATDRKYQFWERRPLSVELETLPIIEQKINYIHMNPVREKWNLSKTITDYNYSSAGLYHEGFNEWDFLTHINAED